jgi:uncharacterized membrane protein
MAKDVADVLGNALGRAAREAVKSINTNSSKHDGFADRVTEAVSNRLDGAFTGSKGLAAGAGAATLIPLAVKGVGKLVGGGGSGDGSGPVGKAGEAVKGAAKGVAKGGKSGGAPGVGKGRRMPVQQDIDIGMPIAQVYKEWTNFEQWPEFMHRLQNVSQEDDKHVTFKTKIWGISKEFRAEIVEQEENARIKWQVTDGVTHAGVVTFHELGPRLTRMELNLDVQPGSLIEKAARGMRHVKRAVRADMARFKAYVLMQKEETPSRSSGSSSGSARSSSSRSASSKRSSSAKSSSSRKRSTSSARKQSSNGGQKRSPSKTRASSNGRSRSSSANGRSSTNGRSRSGSSSSRKQRSGARS